MHWLLVSLMLTDIYIHVFDAAIQLNRSEILYFSFITDRYAHYDNIPSFSDFVPFGGWVHPSIKQFLGTTTACGVGIDKNFY
jgi:hypothetical protein